ncbi:MAG: hypothetical protein AAFS01_12935 [Pseudomonadota bacterium]
MFLDSVDKILPLLGWLVAAFTSFVGYKVWQDGRRQSVRKENHDLAKVILAETGRLKLTLQEVFVSAAVQRLPRNPEDSAAFYQSVPAHESDELAHHLGKEIDKMKLVSSKLFEVLMHASHWNREFLVARDHLIYMLETLSSDLDEYRNDLQRSGALNAALRVGGEDLSCAAGGLTELEIENFLSNIGDLERLVRPNLIEADP